KVLTDAATAEWYDRVYREAGLQAMAPVVIHYDEPSCPHGCGAVLEWIAFNLDPVGQESLVRAWWDGSGFAGRCPACRGWIWFTTAEMSPVDEDRAWPRLADAWDQVAQ